MSFHEHNYKRQLPKVLRALEDGDVALVSEAGVPTVSDPGRQLVRKALESGASVTAAPGPSAVLAALSVSGMPAGSFIFMGFPPRRRVERRRLLASRAAFPETAVIFEAPHRLRDTLEDLLEAWGDRRVTVCRELTKRFEEVFSATVSEALAHFSKPRGEFTLVVEGGTAAAEVWDRQRARDRLAELKRQGMRAREAVSQTVKESGLPRSQVYREWLALANGEPSTEQGFF